MEATIEYKYTRYTYHDDDEVLDKVLKKCGLTNVAQPTDEQIYAIISEFDTNMYEYMLTDDDYMNHELDDWDECGIGNPDEVLAEFKEVVKNRFNKNIYII